MRNLVLVLTLLVPGLAGTARAEIPERFETVTPASEWAAAIEQARASLRALLDGGAPGLSIAVGVDGVVVWAEGFGYADVENAVPVTPLTKFRVGSVSKAMTSIAMARAVERGELDLDEPIQTYLPTFPEKAMGPITTRQLASHRAGVRHYAEDMSDYLVTEHYDNVTDALHFFADDPLRFEPGTEFGYSSHGYNLLSAVIEAASGRPFLEVMRTDVWAPLELLDTVADHTDLIVSNRAAPYARNGEDRLINAPFVDNSYKWAGGGFLSTPSDVVRFGFGVLDNRVIEPATWRELTSVPEDNQGRPADQTYGLGWFVYEDGWVGHGGGSVGGNTLFRIHPEHRVALVIACNLSACLQADPELAGIGDLFVDR